MDYGQMSEAAIREMEAHVGDRYSQARRNDKGIYDCSSLIARGFGKAGYEWGCPGRPVPRSNQEVYDDGFELLYPTSYDLIGKAIPSPTKVMADVGLTRGLIMFLATKGNASNRANKIEHVVALTDTTRIVHARGTAYGVRRDKASLYNGKVCAIVRFNPECDLVKGHQGNRVRKLQRALNRETGANIDVDGDFGAKTYAALLKYQASQKNMPITGRADLETRIALAISDKLLLSMPTLKRGDTGSFVGVMQDFLNSNGYKLDDDNEFGAATETALKDFQDKHGLNPDGICAAITWNNLMMRLDDDEQTAADDWRVEVLGDTVNLRTKPSTAGLVRGVVKRGAILKATGEKMDNWYNVVYNGESLWISGNNQLARIYTIDTDDIPPIVISKGEKITDISEYQGSKFNWRDYAADVLFQIHRVSCGLKKDARFDSNMSNAMKYGIVTYVYMYSLADNVTEIIAETKRMLEFAKPYMAFIKGFFLDAERADITREMGEAFVKVCRDAGVKRVGFYMAHHLYKKMNLNIAQVDMTWIPRYGSNDGTYQVAPAYKCDIHQYTSRGRVNGCGDTTVDLNRITGKGKDADWFTEEDAA